MDRAEVTVGRFRAALAAGFVPDSEWSDASRAGCTFDASGAADEWPMNCVDWSVARAFCAFVAGDLPTESQWEYAASGSGDENLYVWGSEEPTCDASVYGRSGGDDTIGSHDECSALGTGPRPATLGSAGLDTTSQGLVDLAGNLSEWTLDTFVPYTSACADRDRRDDPFCVDPSVELRVLRGADWASPPSDLTVAHRRAACAIGLDHSEGSCGPADALEGASLPTRVGFRCAYPGVSP
jgi:formylglycine-generating enzyme required for sulfatase activity